MIRRRQLVSISGRSAVVVALGVACVATQACSALLDEYDYAPAPGDASVPDASGGVDGAMAVDGSPHEDAAPDAASDAVLLPDGSALCASNNGGCNANATCSVTNGTTTSCACKTGYTGDGVSCAGAATFTANTDLSATNTGSRVCSDGGEMVAYSVTAMAGMLATLNVAPGVGCLSAGDEILLLNLQGTRTASVNVGNYERLTVASVSGTTVTFTTSKQNFYGNGVSDDANLGVLPTTQRVVLQRIPHFTSVTGTGVLSAAAWNGVKGGVFAMDVAVLASVPGITMDFQGYGGAPATFTANTDGAQGESVDGLGIASQASNVGGAGGGTGDRNDNGCEPVGVAGGGAGYSVSGGTAQDQHVCGGNGGAAYGSSATSLFLGSGGGAGGTDNSVADNPPGGFGGAGGGAILLSGTGTVSCNLSASGAAGEGDTSASVCSGSPTSSTTSCWDFAGVGGGGSGGTVVVTGVHLSGTVTVAGGNGGISGYNSAAGGNGAAGRTRLPP